MVAGFLCRAVMCRLGVGEVVGAKSKALLWGHSDVPGPTRAQSCFLFVCHAEAKWQIHLLGSKGFVLKPDEDVGDQRCQAGNSNAEDVPKRGVCGLGGGSGCSMETSMRVGEERRKVREVPSCGEAMHKLVGEPPST